MILTIRTDKPEAEIGLYDQAGTQLNYISWQAHRHLAETLHDQIATLLDLRKTAMSPEPSQTAKNSFSSVDVSMDTSPSEKEVFTSSEPGSDRHAILRKASILQFDSSELKDIDGIVVFKGPGSYTGLRIGVSVANALAYSLGCKVIATNSENWQTDGVNLLSQGKGSEVVLPEYDAPAKTTQPRK